MFIFKFWNETQYVVFTTSEAGETTFAAIGMSDEEVQTLIDQKAHEGAMIDGWQSEWVDDMIPVLT